ncbi:sugar phosphate isomerase/epimerase family protein [Mycobacterium sp. 23]|uniref:sugar phosphate isomerase/epimerase family protein n=1 Tax=Mycobacterium sp. 23 TaxID=3400424 RepID=UPI003AAF204F
MEHLGIGYLSVFGLPPVEFVEVAAALKCRFISMFLRGRPLVPLGYPPFSLPNDAALRTDLDAALGHHGVSITLGDGFLVVPGGDVRRCADDLDVMGDLGIPRLNVVSLDADLSRTFDEFAVLAELAAQRGITTVVEPVPGLAVSDVPTALAAVRHVGRPDFRLLIDTMHVSRSGSTPADLAAIDPKNIGYVQLNDSTRRPRSSEYMEEAMYERLAPGDGELPLRDIIRALPTDLVFELEVPQRSLALAGVSPVDRLRTCVDAARRVMSEAAG